MNYKFLMGLKNFAKTKKFKIGAAALTAIAAVLASYLTVRALSVSDDFSTSNYVDQTWRTTVDTSAGVVRLEEKSCASSSWHCSADDICLNYLGDGDYIIVASTTADSTYVWKTSQTACDRPQCGQDGSQNGDNLVADNTIRFDLAGYSARDYCKSIGGRLATIDELACIYTNRASFGNNFEAGYWSATEHSAAYAWVVNFLDGSQNYGIKDGAYYVRCVRGW
jgi:hypothetical protein